MALLACCIAPKSSTTVIQGETMGTIYTLKYVSKEHISKAEIDDLLEAINQSLSTYIPTSVISQINDCEKIDCTHISLDAFFKDNFDLSKQVHQQTNGYFNPALLPLVHYWGFGYGKKNRLSVDSNKVEQLLQLCNFDDFSIQQQQFSKLKQQQQLDFSAIAKGYAVDQIAALLNNKQINHYLVEIGGELRAKGKNERNEYWRIAIDEPENDLLKRSFKAILSLQNEAVATSGNYRNYRRVGAQQYGHIINPKSGYPEQKEIISATIIAKTCALADAYATACMVMGFEKAKQFLNEDKKLKAYFIYQNNAGVVQTYQTEALDILRLK